MLHLTALDLPGGSRVEVELGYGQDVFTAGAPADVWTRPADPGPGPVVVRYVASGATGGVTLAEYGSGEPWTTTYPTAPVDGSWQNSVTNADLFLHTDPYVEPTFQVWLALWRRLQLAERRVRGRGLGGGGGRPRRLHDRLAAHARPPPSAQHLLRHAHRHEPRPDRPSLPDRRERGGHPLRLGHLRFPDDLRGRAPGRLRTEVLQGAPPGDGRHRPPLLEPEHQRRLADSRDRPAGRDRPAPAPAHQPRRQRARLHGPPPQRRRQEARVRRAHQRQRERRQGLRLRRRQLGLSAVRRHRAGSSGRPSHRGPRAPISVRWATAAPGGSSTGWRAHPPRRLPSTR